MKLCPLCKSVNNDDELKCNSCFKNMENINDSILSQLSEKHGKQFTDFSLIGEGSFGLIYRCFDKINKEERVIKILKTDVRKNKLYLNLFKRECKFAVNFTEEHIVKTYNYHIKDNFAYSIMEYIEGIDLNLFFSIKTIISLWEFKKIVINICRGVHFFHYHSMVHCDLKPGNILINPETLETKIMDLGLSHFTGEEKILQDSIIAGTRRYMSPEQIKGEKQLTAASDNYAVGIVIYELLTGTLPVFHEGKLIPPSANYNLILAGDYSKLNLNHIIDQIDIVLIKCLEKKPENRIHNLTDLELFLENLIPENEDILIKKIDTSSKQREINQSISGLADVNNFNYPTDITEIENNTAITEIHYTREKEIKVIKRIPPKPPVKKKKNYLFITTILIILISFLYLTLWNKTKSSHTKAKKLNLNFSKNDSETLKDIKKSHLKFISKNKKIKKQKSDKISFSIKDVDFKFVQIKSGEFMMGSPEDDKQAFKNEKPRHRVKISKSFYKTEYEMQKFF